MDMLYHQYVVTRLLEYHAENAILTKDEIKDVQQGLEDIKSGRVYTTEQLNKELGLQRFGLASCVVGKICQTIEKTRQKNARIIRDRLLEIRDDPFKTANRLVNVDLYSLRIGQYRIILDLKREQLIIFALSVAKRGRIYDRL